MRFIALAALAAARRELPVLDDVEANRVGDVASETAWCAGTPWPEAGADARRVVVVLRGEAFRTRRTEYSNDDVEAPPCSRAGKRWIRPQLKAARGIVDQIIVPLERRGLDVTVLAAPSNPECERLGEIYDILGRSRVVLAPPRVARNQGQGVRNALEALLALNRTFDGVLLWRIDAMPLAPKDGGSAVEKYVYASPEHAAKYLVLNWAMDHVFWLPWPAVSCFYAAIHNKWPELPRHCSFHDQVGDDDGDDPGCLEVQCFADGMQGGHQCTETMQERVAGWPRRIGFFSGCDFRTTDCGSSTRGSRWWRLIRELAPSADHSELR